MNYFKDKVAIVTGAASGIGKAICAELNRRGAEAVIAGIHVGNMDANAVGDRVHPVRVDVTKAEDMQKLVEETVLEHRRLDFIFNNAGIAVGGELQEMELTHWRHIINVNLWGVIHGTMAAYPVMVKQGFGHIVNIASLGGLVPVPMLTPYATTKHAIVGLSTSLRGEATGLGVKVSVACPGFVRTGIYNSAIVVGANRQEVVDSLLSLRPIGPVSLKATKSDECACAILRGVEQNKAIITIPSSSKLAWWLYRINPGLISYLQRESVKKFRKLLNNR
jgi:NAD(P)-dependent dehydrogenase (short-subunit alcohol dehydrogenase family)